ncbi:MAG TPA: peptide chain release factor N(5)-glutamine methyltransferase [Solirubrobacterales bacterium]|jgi:release factor glutamine methyltransferase|nr:peptide chain release factor N(5)-glutamine methyltransferase [Solirubrobacterales bacterium]
MSASDIHPTGVGKMSDAATAGTVREALAGAADALRAAGVESPRLDAEILLAEAMGWERARLVVELEAGVAPDAGRRFAEMVRRRLRREPVAYILGRKGFRRIELEVDRRVLVPRPETELLVELALELAPRRVLDVGTGSGAVALAIADELRGCGIAATDTSAAALEVARANAARLGLTARVDFIAGMLPGDHLHFDLLLANLPYVSEAEWAGLEPEVTEWEPREALLAGPDGLDAIRSLVAVARGVAPVVALEVGAGQAPAAADLLLEAGFGEVETRADLAGIPRVVKGAQ